MTAFEIGTLVTAVVLAAGVLYAIFRDDGGNHGSPFPPPR